jgi:hypothetical protein
MESIIDPIISFDRFSFYQPSKKKLGEGFVDSEIKFSTGDNQSVLMHTQENSNIWFGISNDIFNTKHFKVAEGPYDLSKYELIELSKKFSFVIEPNPHAKDYLIGRSKDLKFKSCLMGAVQNYMDQYYLLIYVKRGSTDFEDDMVFIHGIWKVDLSEDFKRRIYRHLNS